MTIKYQFIMTDEQDEYGPGREIKHTIIGEQTWDELLPHFQEWLKGVGYVFNGEIAMIGNALIGAEDEDAE